MLSLLHTCFSKSWGGMEMYVLSSARDLRARGHAVELLAIKNSRLWKEAVDSDFIVHSISSSGYFSLAAILRCAHFFRRHSYDIIHTHASKDLWILVPALKLCASKTPLFLSKHLGSFIKKKDVLHRFLYNRVTKALAVSRVIMQNLTDTTPLPPSKIALLHNSIDTKRFNPELVDKTKIRKEYHIPEDSLLIGMTARFTPGKGHETFFQAAAAINRSYPNVFFLVVGEASRGEEEYHKSMLSLAESLALKNAFFAGYRSDMPAVLAAMDIFVFPSEAEAFGLALAEAMAMGLPSVAANSDGILDIVISNETGLLFKNKVSVDLAEKLAALIQNKELRSSFGIAARKRIVEHFDVPVITDKLISFYQTYQQSDENNQ